MLEIIILFCSSDWAFLPAVAQVSVDLFFHLHPPPQFCRLGKGTSWFHRVCDSVYNMYICLINLCVCATCEYCCYICAWGLGSKAMARKIQKQGCCLPEPYLWVNCGNHLRVSCNSPGWRLLDWHIGSCLKKHCREKAGRSSNWRGQHTGS